MKIKMLTLAAGPAGVHTIGSVVDVAPDIATQMIKSGYAVAVQPEQSEPVKVIQVVETAEAEPAPERAVVNAAKGKNTGNKSGKSTGTRRG